jgi:DNA-binding MarR family transcriptional regulator
MSNTLHNDTTMQQDLEQYYLRFIDFLLLQKRILIDIGLLYGLTPMQTMALLILDKQQPMSYLTATFNCDASNVTGIVDGLQAKHLVQRLENPDDRRVRIIELSQHGKELRNTLLKHLVDKSDPNPIFTKLNRQELKQFFGLIDKLTND